MHIPVNRGEVTPHILVVSEEPRVQKKVSDSLASRKIGHESLKILRQALERLEEAQAPIPTGVISDGLNGRWRQIAPAAEQAGASLVLLTTSKIFRDRASSEGYTCYLMDEFNRGMSGTPQSNRLLNQIMAELAPQPQLPVGLDAIVKEVIL